MPMDEHAFVDEGRDRAPQGRARHVQHVGQFRARRAEHPPAAKRPLAISRLSASPTLSNSGMRSAPPARRPSILCLRPRETARQEVYTWPIMKHKRASTGMAPGSERMRCRRLSASPRTARGARRAVRSPHSSQASGERSSGSLRRARRSKARRSSSPPRSAAGGVLSISAQAPRACWRCRTGWNCRALSASTPNASVSSPRTASACSIDSSGEDDAHAADQAIDALRSDPHDIAIAVSASGATPFTLAGGAPREGEARRRRCDRLPHRVAARRARRYRGRLRHRRGSRRRLDPACGGNGAEGGARRHFDTRRAELGHVYDGLMINVRPENAKLRPARKTIVERGRGRRRGEAAEARARRAGGDVAIGDRRRGRGARSRRRPG